jgi:heme/copper-type cytochrome/quinol oxidase subunit 2
MKNSMSKLHVIVLVSVLSGILLFGVVSSLYNGHHTQVVNAKKDRTQQQQQSSIPGTIQLSAKELPSGYRWIDTTNGVINPTMNFNVGAAKTIQLKNPSDDVHQLVVDNPKGNQLATSGDIAPGSSSQLSFKPDTTGIFGYHCIYHPTTMKGIIHVQ